MDALAMEKPWVSSYHPTRLLSLANFTFRSLTQKPKVRTKNVHACIQLLFRSFRNSHIRCQSHSLSVERVDPGDRGSEYRSIMGLPGGTQHPVYPGIEQVASKAGFKLVPGQGNDPDTLGKQIVYVYDTAKFPFYPGEVYHQYHDDFQNPPYGRAYSKLADLALVEGRIRPTGCPDRV